MSLFKRLSTIMVIAVLLTACGGKEERKEKYLERGKAYLEEGNLNKARIEFKNVAQIDPKSGQAFMYLGLIEEKEKEWLKAFGNYRRAIELDPSLVDPRVTMAKLYLAQAGSHKSQGNAESEANARSLAKEQIDAILEMEPANIEGLTLQSSVWADEGETGKAADQLRKILSTNPEMTSAAFFLSAMQVREGNSDDAAQTLLNALPNSDDPDSLRGRLVQLYLTAGKNDQAESMIRELVKSDPDKLQYRAALASFLIDNDRLDDAEQALRDAITADPTDASRYLLLSDFQSNKRTPEIAISELENAIKAHPELNDLRFGLINLYKKNGQLNKVREELEGIIVEHDLDPTGLNARVVLAQLLASESQQPDKVNSLLSEVLTENPQDVSALMLRGRIAGNDTHWVDAINDFRSVLKDTPNSIDALKLLASAHLANNEGILAKDTLKKALDISPTDTSMRLLLASILSNENNHDQALTQIDRVLEIAPENQQALNSKFNLLALKGDSDGMSVVAQTLQSSSPESEDGFIREARLLFAQKEYDKSMGMAKDILAKNPTSMTGLLLQADIYATQKDYGNALRIVRQLKQVQPENAIGYYREAKILIAQENNDGAITAFKEALKKAPSSVEILTGLTMLQIQEGETAEATNHLQEILSDNADHPLANDLLGKVYAKNKDYAKAGESFSRQIAITPGNASAYVQLASVRIAQDNKDSAVQVYEEGMTAIPNNPRILLSLAGLKEELKEYDAAIGLYEQLLNVQPGNAVGTNNLTVLLSDHRTDAESLNKAIEYAETLAQAEQPVFKDTAAWAYYKLGDTAKALELAINVVDEMPDVSVFNYHLGMIYLQNDDPSNAKKYLSKAVSTGEFDDIDLARSALEKL